MSGKMGQVVNAKDAIAGQWYIIDMGDGDEKLCLCCCANRVWNEEHETIYLADLDELVHLPD